MIKLSKVTVFTGVIIEILSKIKQKYFMGEALFLEIEGNTKIKYILFGEIYLGRLKLNTHLLYSDHVYLVNLHELDLKATVLKTALKLIRIPPYS